MTSLISGFGDSLESSDPAARQQHGLRAQVRLPELRQRQQFLELIKRPDLTDDDARAIAASPLVRRSACSLAAAARSRAASASPMRGAGDQAVRGRRRHRDLAETNFIKLAAGPLLRRLRGAAPPQRDGARLRARPTRCSRHASTRSARQVRVGRDAYTVVGVLGQAPGRARRRRRLRGHPVHDVREAVPTPRFRGFLYRPLTIGGRGAPRA